MSILPDVRPRAHLPPHLEALELRDLNARDSTPLLAPDAFPADALTDAEMERMDRLAACPAGYRDAACEACRAPPLRAGRGGGRRAVPRLKCGVA